MEKRFMMLQGLPASGKSTFAAQEKAKDPGGVLIVNKDSIRRELEALGWEWSHKNESDVIRLRDERIVKGFEDPNISLIISDDTNFGKKHLARFQELCQKYGAKIEIHRFDTSVEECVRRDSFRVGKAKVGAKVIEKMALDNGLLAQMSTKDEIDYAAQVYKPDKYKKSAIICDLDGTLALNQHGRSFYDASTCDKDACCEEIKIILECFYRFMGWDIIYLSGREEAYRDKTQLFLQINHCPPGQLLMRKTGDHRKDAIIKLEIFNAKVRDEYYVRFVLDDRDQVVKMWRGLGIKCLQVAEGDF